MININKFSFIHFKRLAALTTAIAFMATMLAPGRYAFAQAVTDLPAVGERVSLSAAYNPAIVAGITLHPEDPLKISFILDTGDDKISGDKLKQESEKLISYFLAALTVPDDEMWVNLSPYEKDRIVADGLGETVMGNDMLAQDYLLKQLAASMMYPEGELGSQFWAGVYKKAAEKFGTSAVPADTFNKIWIVPDKAVIYAKGANVFIADSHLNVMLEDDYRAMEFHQNATDQSRAPARDRAMENPDRGLDKHKGIRGLSAETKALYKEVILPAIEKDVNEGKNFAPLRQIFHSMILAAWYKKNLQESLLGKSYVNQNVTSGVDVEDKESKTKIYEQYLAAFKKGVYNYIKEDYDPATKQSIPRKYFSGGENFKSLAAASSAVDAISPDSWLAQRSSSPMVTVETESWFGGKVDHVNDLVGPQAFSSSPVTGPVVEYGDKEDTAEFDQIAGDLFRRMRESLNGKLDKKRFLEIMASSFGITSPDAEPAEGFYNTRHKVALEAIKVLMTMPKTDREDIIATILQEQSNVSWMASGNHRYMELVLAIVNLMSEKSVFDQTSIAKLIAQNPEYRYLIENDLSYANPFGVEEEWMPAVTPQLNVSVPESQDNRYRWLDVGSTIAADGSPVLNFINQSLKGLEITKPLELYGSDTYISPYHFQDGKITPSAVYLGLKAAGGSFQYNEVTYYDAKKQKHNVASQEFQLEGSFDFISMIMTLHHLTSPGEVPETRPLARNVQWIDDEGSPITPQYDLTKTQQESIERLLRALNPDNGILFLHLKEGVVLSGKMYSGNKRNDGQLVMIQRKDETTFQIFTPTLAFRPEIDPYDSTEILMVPHPAPLYKTVGIRGLFSGQSEAFFTDVMTWLRRADMLVFRYRQRDVSMWGQLQLAAEALRSLEGQERLSIAEGLGKIFSAYLSKVPDTEPIKARLLMGVREMGKQYDLLDSAKRDASSPATEGAEGEAGHIIIRHAGIKTVALDSEAANTMVKEVLQKVLNSEDNRVNATRENIDINVKYVSYKTHDAIDIFISITGKLITESQNSEIAGYQKLMEAIIKGIKEAAIKDDPELAFVRVNVSPQTTVHETGQGRDRYFKGFSGILTTRTALTQQVKNIFIVLKDLSSQHVIFNKDDVTSNKSGIRILGKDFDQNVQYLITAGVVKIRAGIYVFEAKDFSWEEVESKVVEAILGKDVAKAEAVSRKYAGKTVLVVDDEEERRSYLANILKSQGWTVVTAKDGQEALNKIEELGAEKVNLMTTDWRMDPGMGGEELLHSLREKGLAGIRTIVVSSETLETIKFSDLEKEHPAIRRVDKKSPNFSELIEQAVEALVPPAKSASSPADKNPGGIDLNPRNLNLETSGETIQMQFPASYFEPAPGTVEGLVPVIINITPVSNLPLLLGLRASQKGPPSEQVATAN